ncbi:adenosylcobinamide-GDP ribazoletransferase [Frankia sp. AgB1.9]|uniref:adenosylcobinamide-GDP ribazoletransferase n=1 Tax=unclassified Frankia TaxID=2632575 RepID=UPI001932A4DE|nr:MULTISPECIES: adenosylcobinamide-GDP ribazoletransferase [unclassified Frankia]MBL7486938.1 adenosylcobinamide-GDP ribazoletransferase [Frankia sp. AgW1.1]MBL7551849.1 adenosylcobinamide-GDP ribazoletransferase [Frankia sp. AgB1.9]MBL7624801.1 adenosylcobinamide-GDP ribazoletransferase [Frankia sp. AgB1.8]
MTTPDGGGGPGDEPGYPNERYAGFDPGDDTGNYTQPLGGPAPRRPAPGTPIPGAPTAGNADGWRRGDVEDVGVEGLMSYGDQDVPDQRQSRRGWKVPTSGGHRARPGADGYPADAPSTRPSSGQRPPTQATAAFGRRVGDGVGWVRERAAGGVTALRGRRAETPAASRRRGAGGEPAALRALPLAVGMFTVIPVPANRTGRDAVDTGLAGWALRWLPVLGGLLALVGWAVSLIFWRGYGTGAGFLGAVAWVGVMALLTRGLHLDGLADLADGLGSRRPAEEALTIMRRSDIGPFGVTSLIAVLLLQLGGVLTVMASASRAQGLVVLVVAAVAGRLAALDAARPAVPPARPGGFGALVAGTAPASVRAAAVGAALVLSWLLLALTSTSLARALWLPFAVLVGLAAGRLVTWHSVRRLDGITGDVFGALVEITTTVTLLTVGAIIAWGGI